MKPEEWGWAFNMREGVPQVLEQEFEHKRDSDGVSQSRKAVSPARNPCNWPRLTWQQVRNVYDRAKAEDTSLRRAFLKEYDRRKLSDEQLEVLSNAPDLYIAGPRPLEVDQAEIARREKAAAFLAEVDAPKVEAPQPKLRQAVKV